MSRQQWGNGYGKGYTDALLGRKSLLEKEDFGIDFIYDEIKCTDEEVKQLSFSILKRLRDKKKKFICPCNCCDSSILEEGAEIWTNFNQVKIYYYDDYGEARKSFIMFTEICPICGGLLNINGNKTNKYKVI